MEIRRYIIMIMILFNNKGTIRLECKQFKWLICNSRIHEVRAPEVTPFSAVFFCNWSWKNKTKTMICIMPEEKRGEKFSKLSAKFHGILQGSVGTRLHTSISIVIIYPYSFSPIWWRWRRCLWRPNILLKNREQDPQRNVGGGRSWTSRALLTARWRSSSRWQVGTNISTTHLGWSYAREIELQQRFPRFHTWCWSVPRGRSSTDTSSVVLGLGVFFCRWRVLQTGWFVWVE